MFNTDNLKTLNDHADISVKAFTQVNPSKESPLYAINKICKNHPEEVKKLFFMGASAMLVMFKRIADVKGEVEGAAEFEKVALEIEEVLVSIAKDISIDQISNITKRF